MLPNLDELLHYQHPQVLRAYIRNHPTDPQRASELFADMLRYLWVSRKHKADRAQHPGDAALDFTLVMHEEMRDIDNMWHNFILYTQDYTEFCQRNFGEYLHHQPDVAETTTHTEAEFADEMAKYLDYVYDQLGETTVRRWFATHLEDAH